MSMKVKKPATISVSEPTTLEPGKEYAVQEVRPAPTQASKPVDKFVGQFMSFHRFSEAQLREYYENVDTWPRNAEQKAAWKKLEVILYDRSLGMHPESPLDPDIDDLLEFKEMVDAERKEVT